jgi:two-component system OmpR family response regulator
MRILIVEDDRKMARILTTGLRAEGHATDLAETGEAAVALLARAPYEAVILDVMLPGRDGLEVCRTLRAAGNSVGVLMLTARDAVPDRVAGLDAGADDYLVKPFAFDELLARLRSLGRRGETARPPLLTHGDLVLDPARRQVSLGGAPVELTSREFALLEAFLQHPGEVLTRTRLLERVWDEHYDGLSNLIEVYVGRLRRKLSRPGRPLALRTVRGAGYVLDPLD